KAGGPKPGKAGDARRKTADARGTHGTAQAAGAGSGARASDDSHGGSGSGDSDHDADSEDEPRVPLAQIPTTPEGRAAKAPTDLAKPYAARFPRLRHPGPFDPASELINAVASSLDPHTTYLPPAEKANFDIRMSGSLEGIGAQLRERDDYVEVVEIVP